MLRLTIVELATIENATYVFSRGQRRQWARRLARPSVVDLTANYAHEVSSADYTPVELLIESQFLVDSAVRPATH